MTAWPSLLFLLVGFAVIPMWVKLAKKLGSKKTYFYALICTAVSTASFIFATNYTLVIIIAALGGIGHGGQGVILSAISSEAIDNATLKNNIREESSYHGILRFFSATGIFWQVLIFAIVGTINKIGVVTETSIIIINRPGFDLIQFGLGKHKAYCLSFNSNSIYVSTGKSL